MDPKMIEMNNLRVLNDYLNQTIDVLVRQPRFGQPGFQGFSPFSPTSATPGIGTDTVYGPWQATPGYSPFGPQGPFSGMPLYGAAFAAMDPFMAQRSFGPQSFGPSFSPSWPSFGPSYTPSWPSFGPSYTPGFGPSYTQAWGPSVAPSFGAWQQQSWGPMAEVTRQAHLNQVLAAKQSVLEAMCRACGIPV